MNIIKRFFEMLFGECGEPSATTFSQMKAMASTLDDEEKINQMWQASEDRQYAMDAHRMASDMYMQWLKGSKGGTIPYYGIIIPEPVRFIYTIHDEATAKYKNANLRDMANSIFKQLKNQQDVTQNS